VLYVPKLTRLIKRARLMADDLLATAKDKKLTLLFTLFPPPQLEKKGLLL